MLKNKMYFEFNKKFDNIIFRLIIKPDNKQFVFLFLAFPPPLDGCASHTFILVNFRYVKHFHVLDRY